MTDRELLEAAARAAGIQIDYSDSNGGGRFNTGFDLAGNAVLDWHNGATWNPLTDDGDAMRLAAKLNLVVDFFDGEVISANKVVKFDVNDIASARLAIVRAAASMSPDLAAGGREGVR